MTSTSNGNRLELPVIDWPITLTGEILFFNLLSRILLSLPEKDWLKPLVVEEIFDELPFAADRVETQRGRELLSAWTAQLSGELDDQSLLDLKVDFTRLFSGSRTIPVAPWESVYFSEDRLVFQERTLEVRQWYRRFGLEPVKLHKEPDDHIGIELSFVAHLAARALAAHEAGDEVGFNELVTAQKEFLAEHLILWGPLWASLVTENAKSDFYSGVAYLVLGALIELAELFTLQIPDYKFS